ncbi:hypothetical protein BH23BAC3_BH23BAC3_19870 [soil metagenome]
MLNSTKAIIFVLFLGFLAGCNDQQQMDNQDQMDHQTNQQQADQQRDQQPDFDELVAVLHPTEGNEANGVVRFTKTDNGVSVEGEIHGLEPNSNHGFHIHEFGDCTASDGTSAGGHFDPHDQPHGGPDDQERHVGDMGNITSDDNGTAEISYTDPIMTFSGEASILGRGVIVHAGEDDLESQPTGDAGDRLSCGVIGVAEHE